MVYHNSYARPTRRVWNAHSHRSSHAKRIDEAMRAPFAKSESQWLAQPNRFDIPEVDAPKRAETVSKEEQNRRLEEIHKHEANRSPTSHNQVKANLNTHKFFGTGR